MSLSQRVTAIEEHGGSWSRDSSTSSRHRKMSFNPVGAWTEPAGEEPTIGAFEVPKWKRLCRHARRVRSRLPMLTNRAQCRLAWRLSTASSLLELSSAMLRSSQFCWRRVCIEICAREKS